tara:strand:+ start:277 stop:534 length:258 start_codon:yes stop_codon:yes gene_type:complete
MYKKEIFDNIIKSIVSIKKIQDKKLLLNPEFDLFSSGLLDSLQLMHLIILIEKKFKINFTTEDKESKKFRYVDGIVKIIAKKLKN